MNLYNKYRPRKFSDVIQYSVTEILKSQILTDNTRSTYLFSGPSGTGKTTLARIMAMALLCDNLKEGEPCGECNSCGLIINSRNRDVQEINCSVSGGVGDTRDLISEKMLYSPIFGKYQIIRKGSAPN